VLALKKKKEKKENVLCTSAQSESGRLAAQFPFGLGGSLPPSAWQAGSAPARLLFCAWLGLVWRRLVGRDPSSSFILFLMLPFSR